MKRLFTTLVALIAFSFTVFAQVPQGFNYQAVVRNTAGQLMQNRSISVRISILRGSETGTAVYQQVGSVNTNANGLFTLIVGENSAEFASIDWGNGPYYILSEIDPQGGDNYILSTTQKILAVPYAHYADYARRIDDNFVYNEQDPRFRAWGYNYDSLQGAPTRLSDFINDLEFPYDSLQPSISGDTLFFGDNNNTYVILPHLGDGTGTITIHGDTLYMGDQYVILPSNDPLLRLSGDTLYMGDQYVVLPDPNISISGDTIYMGDQYVVLHGIEMHGDTLYMGDQYVVLPHYIPTLNEVLSVNNNAFNQIHNVYTPTAPYDAVNKLYVDSLIALVNARIDSLDQALNDRMDSMGNIYQNIMDSMSQHIYNLEHPIIDGALPGIFSVSATTRINFSKGNLQYRPRIKTWRFAEHQYDLAGSDNNNVYMQAYCTSWIDLFGYGTSSWDGGAGRYMPYETTTNNTEYTEATDGNDLTEFYANGDWGYYNPIINGGNQMATWRTLTYSEWTYLLTQRPNAAQLRGMATVVSTPGYIILPDDWQLPAGQNFVNTDTSYTTNVYNAANWAIMEAAGAVFLPAAGMRIGSATTNIGTIGNYWTASHVNGTTGYSFHIGASACGMQNTMTYSTGCSVRVVHEY